MDQPFLSLNLLVSGAILALFLSFSVFLKIVRSFTHIFTHTEHIHFIFDSSALCTDFETLVQRRDSGAFGRLCARRKNKKDETS